MNQQRICVITDTGTDTPADFCAKHDVRVVPLRVNYSDGSSYESHHGAYGEKCGYQLFHSFSSNT